MVWLRHTCKCDKLLKLGTCWMWDRHWMEVLVMSKRSRWPRDSYRLWGWHHSDHPRLTSHRCDTGCACDVFAAPPEKGLVLDLPGKEWSWEGQRVSKWRSLEAAGLSDQRSPQQFCHLPVWLSSGFSGDLLEDGSYRKFVITSLSVIGFLNSHPIVSEFPRHVNAWVTGGGNETADGRHFESEVVSVPTEGLILNMQIIFSSTFPSSC